MPLITKSLDELHAIAAGVVRAHIDGADTAPGSDYDTSARMVAAVGLLNQRQAEDLAAQILPENAEGEFVDAHARARGIERQPAAKALGKVQITASAGSATQPDASELTHVDGTEFATTAPGTMALPAWTGKTVAPDSAVGRVIVAPNTTGMAADDIVSINGAQRAIREVIASISAIDFYEPLPAVPSPGVAVTAVRGKVVPFEASEAGAGGNKQVGDVLTLAAPTAGIAASARIVECGGGGEAETTEELRARCIDHDAARPGGGSLEHIRELARTTPGVRIADAVVFPGFRGLGTIDVVPIGVDGARVTGSLPLTAVLAQLESELPYHADVAVTQLQHTVAEYDVDVTITTELGYERDYIDSGRAIAVSPASTTTLLYLTSSLAGVAEVGDRVLVTVKVAGTWKTLQRTLTSIDAVAANTIELNEPLPVAPASTDPQVLPGGPLAEPAIAALEQLYESLGPSRRNLSPVFTWERYPLPTVAWDDTLRRARIDAVLMAIRGAANVTITTPATDQQPGAKEVIRRGKVRVRFTES